MKKNIKTVLRYLLFLFIIITSLFILSGFFKIIFFPSACIHGENISRELAIKSIDRGDYFLPENIKNVTFRVTGRNNPRGVISFMGKLDFNDFDNWCKKQKINLIRDTHIGNMIRKEIFIDLNLPTPIINTGYRGEHEIDFAYDDISKTCYVRLYQIGPLRSLSDFEQVWITFFSYFTDYWRDLEVKDK